MKFIAMLLVVFIVIGIMFNVVYMLPGGDVKMPLTFENIQSSLEGVSTSIDEYRYDLRYFEILFYCLGSYFNPGTSTSIGFGEVLFFSEINSYGCYLFYDDLQTIGPDAKLISFDTANYNIAFTRYQTYELAFSSLVSVSKWNVYNSWDLFTEVLTVLQFIAFTSCSAMIALGGAVQLAWDQVVVVFQLVSVPLRLCGFLRFY